MHIVIIANGFQVDYMLNLLNSLSGKVDRIDFIGSSIYPESMIDKRIHIHNLRGSHDENVGFLTKAHRIISYYLKLITFLFRTHAGIIHMQWLRFNFLEGILLTLLIRIKGKRIIYTAHDVLPHSRNNLYNRLLFKVIYKIQDNIIVHSDFIRSRIIGEFNISPRKVFMVKHGLYKISSSHTLSAGIAREKLGFDQHQRIILFFGIITKYKGLDILLEAFDSLEKELPELRLLIAGKVSAEYRDEYNHLVNTYRSEKITRLAYHINEKEMELIFKAADLVVLPYREASQSGVLFLAYAYGKPVIAPSLGGFLQDIEVGKTGLLFEPFSAVSLASTIKEWMLNRKVDNSYIREYAQNNYSWDASAACLVKIYQQA